MRRALVNIGLALAILLSALGFARVTHPAGLPTSLVQYVPPDYDAYGQPVSARNDSLAFPKLWLHPNGRWNLVGVKYQFWSPSLDVPYGAPAPRSIRRVWVNYWGWLSGPPQPDDALEYSGFVDPKMTLFPGVDDDALVTIKSGGAVVTRADTVLEGKAWIVVGCPTWTRDDTLGAPFRLVPETFHR